MKIRLRTLKKLFTVQAILIAVLFVLSACSIGKTDNSKKMSTIDSQNLKTLCKLSKTKLKNHDRIEKILSELPGYETIKKFSTSDATINITYSLHNNSDIPESDFNNYWITNDSYKKIFVNNATALLALITDLRYVNLTLVSSDNKYSFSITRGELEPLYGMDIRNLSKDASRWRSFAINKRIKSSSMMKKLFYSYPIKAER